MDHAMPVRIEAGFDDALARVKEAFQAQGFGTLTEIDVQSTLKHKIDVDIERYAILGVCNPTLAHRALETDRSVGLLLPCTVVVREHEGGTLVEALDPAVMVTLAARPELTAVAEEAKARVEAALAQLRA